MKDLKHREQPGDSGETINLEKKNEIDCRRAIHVLKINKSIPRHFTRGYIMGSFATSLHVKANDAAAVAEALRRLLLAEGYEATEEEPERGLWAGTPSPIRAIHVSSAHEGWVSLLDNEAMSSLNLPAVLSDRLQTHAINFFVNDSDSWHYQLFLAGQKVDEFDSVPDDEEDFDEDDEEPDNVAELGASMNVADAQRMIQERALQWQQQLLQQMPPHLRELQQKWRTTGRIAPEEMQEYNEWMRSKMPNILDQVKELRGMISSQRASQAAQRIDSSRLQGHLELLRPLLQGNVKDSRVLGILSEKDTFAENTLDKFLALLGIASYYAYLNYAYLEESTTEDLSRKSIHLVEHLRFKRPSGRAGHLRLVP